MKASLGRALFRDGLPATAAATTPAATSPAIHGLPLFGFSQGFQLANGFLGFGGPHGIVLSYSPGIVLKLAGTFPAVLPADHPGGKSCRLLDLLVG
jgi:hypothetical protein